MCISQKMITLVFHSTQALQVTLHFQRGAIQKCRDSLDVDLVQSFLTLIWPHVCII
jgi:hypothetical protein